MQNAKLHQEKFLLRCSKQGNNYNQRNICPSSFSPFPTRNRPPKRDACFFYLPSAITKNLTCPNENTNTNTNLIQFIPLWTLFFLCTLYIYIHCKSSANADTNMYILLRLLQTKINDKSSKQPRTYIQHIQTLLFYDI